MWSTVVNLFRDYMGTGLIVIWFLISLIFLLLKEKRKPVRILFIYVPIILLLLFFNPLFAKVIYGYIGNEIYYRILWLIPFGMVIAYTVAKIVGGLSTKKGPVFAIVAAIIVAISGSYIYANPYFHKAENWYHVPQSVVDICDAIEVPGREVLAVFPMELIPFVRQYSPVVCMPYGREMNVERWNFSSESGLYDAMEAEVIDVSVLVEAARQDSCAYIILPADKERKGDFTQYDFELFGEMDGYVIYKDSTVSLEIS